MFSYSNYVSKKKKKTAYAYPKAEERWVPVGSYLLVFLVKNYLLV